MKIAVVILNWNGVNLLKAFLPSVIKYSNDAQVYIIDNASTDDSIGYIKTNYPEVKCIQNSENKGYAGGYNEGLKEVEDDIFILLNSDVEVSKDWLKPIKTKFESSKKIAVIQPKILDYNRPEYFEYAGAAGGFIDAYAYPYCRGRIFSDIEKDKGQYDNDIEIFWASGACFAIRKEIFEKFEGFDESYFAHQEEIDLCWRISNSGYKIWFCHESVVFHLGGGTLKNLNPKKTFLNFRNSLYNVIKNVPQHKWFNVLFIRLLLDGLASLRFIFLGQFGHLFAIIKAHWIMFSRFFIFFNKRKGKLLKDNYFHKKSIVYQYYVLNQKTFKDLE